MHIYCTKYIGRKIQILNLIHHLVLGGRVWGISQCEEQLPVDFLDTVLERNSGGLKLKIFLPHPPKC